MPTRPREPNTAADRVSIATLITPAMPIAITTSTSSKRKIFRFASGVASAESMITGSRAVGLYN